MDRRTFEQLSLQHLEALHRLAMQLARNAEDAADLVQETYARALRASERFEETGGGMRPWLFKILHNAFYSSVTKSRPAAWDMEEAQSRGPGPDEPLPAWDLASMDWEQVDGRLKRAIEGLKPEYRTVLLLWGVEGLKYREIAEIQGIPIGTVMSRLFRARSVLETELRVLAEEKRIGGS